MKFCSILLLGVVNSSFLNTSILESQQTNVVGSTLEKCGGTKTTGFYRDGFCTTGSDDRGTHVVCAKMTQEFLEGTKA